MRILAHLNPLLRSLAAWLPTENALRKSAARWWGRWLEHRGTDVRVRLHDRDLWLSARWRSLDTRYEEQALGGFLEAIRPGDTVWDVGGHIGLYSVMGALRVGSTGKVVAWEPSPVSFAELNHHLEINGLADRCRTINELIADAAKQNIEFAVDSHNSDSSTNRILADAIRTVPGHRIHLRANTLDHWAEELGGAPDVMKMDIEGAEWFAFAGARRLLGGEFGKRPKILLSSHPAGIAQYGGQVAALDKQARQYGYRVLALDGKPTTISDFAEYWLIPE